MKICYQNTLNEYKQYLNIDEVAIHRYLQYDCSKDVREHEEVA